jgi:autotransporter-associated beta strand protein/parallel beta-helix repeat protein
MLRKYRRDSAKSREMSARPWRRLYLRRPMCEPLEVRRLLSSTPFPLQTFAGPGDTGLYPADPSAAAGAVNVLAAVNSSVALYGKSGSLIGNAPLDTSGGNNGFLRSVDHAGYGSFDPVVTYDTYSGRYVVVADEVQAGTDGQGHPLRGGIGASNSYIMVAVSTTSSPGALDVTAGTSNWYFYSFQTNRSFNGSNSWLDYPQVAEDANSIYITGNYYTFGATPTFAGTDIIKLDKSPLLGGSYGGRSDILPPSSVFSLQPVRSVGRAASLPQLFVDTQSTSGVRIWELNSSNQLSNPAKIGAAYTVFPSSTITNSGGVPQPGTSDTLSAVSDRMTTAVWQNNSLWTAHTVADTYLLNGNSVTVAAVRWYQVNTTGGTYTLTQWGDINPGQGLSAFMPALAVDAAGNLGITYTQSGPGANQFPAMMIATRTAADPAGYVSPGSVVEQGATNYDRVTSANGIVVQPWGLYAGISADGWDDSSFWAFGEYPASQTTWQTEWSNFTVISPDRFEPDNTLATAANVGVAPGVHLNNLSIDSATDDDWYRFQMVRPDSVDLALGFQPGVGQLQFTVTDSLGNPLGSSTATGTGAKASLTLAAGTYYVHVSGVGGAVNRYSLAIDPTPGVSTTRVLYVNDGSSANDVYTMAPGNDANDGLTPSTPKATVQALLASYSLGPHDLVVIDTGTYGGNTVTIDKNHAGAAFAGSPYGSTFSSMYIAWELVNASNTLLYDLTFSNDSNGIYATPDNSNNPSTSNTFQSNVFTNVTTAIQINSGNADQILGNTISGGPVNANSSQYGLYLSSEGAGGIVIRGNTVTGQNSYAAEVTTAGQTTIDSNTFAQSGNGLYLNTAGVANLTGNQVFQDGGTGLYLGTYTINSVSGTIAVFSNNAVHDDGTGLFSNTGSLLVYGNAFYNNTTGILGYGTFGGTDWSAPNDIYSNATGIHAYAGDTVRFNRIHGNTVQAILVDGYASNVTINNNVIFRNPAEGIVLDRASSVAITSNTIYTPAGDGVRIQDGSSNVSLENNIIWTDKGYDLYVTTDSQVGFASDYNNLYTTQPSQATLVWWQKPFNDLFDWQVEANYDNHSIGYTSVNPALDNPNFVNLAGDNYLLPDSSATGFKSTSVAAGNPSSPFNLETRGPDGDRIDLGAYGNTALAAISPSQYVRIDYPTYYTDFLANVGHVILWHTYDVTDLNSGTFHKLTGSLDIDLYDTSGNFVEHITTLPANTPSFGWNTAGITPNIATRYRIKLTYEPNTALTDQSREGFSIPVDGSAGSHSYYINDASQTGDEYTTAVGDDRNTGSTPGDPKANLLALLRSYPIGPSDTVYIDTGYYVNVRNVVISNDVNIGVGGGATFTGPVMPGHAAIMDRQNPNSGATNIELNDGNFVTLENLTLTGANLGLWVHNQSTHLNANHLTVSNNSGDGIRIESDSAQTAVNSLTAFGNAGTGITVATGIASLSNSLAYNNGNIGMYLYNQGAVTVSNNLAYNNANYGIDLTSAGGALVEDNEVYGSSTGIWVSSGNSGGPSLVGSTNLALGLGNKVHNNSYRGIYAQNSVVVGGNSVYNQTNSSAAGIELYQATAQSNVVYNNAEGIYTTYYTSGTILDNRVYGNSVAGIDAYNSSLVQGNTVYSNGIGIIGDNYYGFTGTISNNVVYANSQEAILIHHAQPGATVVNNTIYQTAADGVDVDTGSSGLNLRNNIVWTTSGYDLSIASDSQVGFQSDYNILYTTGTGQVAFWQAKARSTLAVWQNTAFTDQNSLSTNPLFITNVANTAVGYISTTQDGRSDDFHEQSLYGSDHGGSLSPVLDLSTGNPTSGLPIVQNGTYTVDASQSPGIDRGSPADSFVNEPNPNGGFINIGAYGNTNEASESPTQFVLVTKPVGGELWPENQTFPIRWRYHKPNEDALEYDGVQDYVDMGNPSNGSLDLGTNGTIEAWVKFDSLPSYNFMTIASKDVGSGNQNKWIFGYANNYSGVGSATFFAIDDPGVGSIFLSGNSWTPVVGQWYHLALVKSGNSYTFYRNGVLDGTASTTIPVPNPIGAHFTVGQAESNFYFHGQIDELRLWNTARTQAAIQGTMNQVLAGNEAGLAGDWQFDEGSGLTAHDKTANHNDGTLMGANQPTWVTSSAPVTQVNIDLYQLVGGVPVFVQNIASNLANTGEYDWTIPPTITPGSNYLVEVTRLPDQDATTIVGQSLGPFTIAPPQSNYYVDDPNKSAPDSHDWTTAPGDDTNSGLDPAHPKASIAALLNAYPTLGAGATIWVDNGNYTLSTNTVVSAAHSGVTIVGYNPAIAPPTFSGAADPTRHSLLNRGNSSAGSYVFDFQGAANATLDYLQMTGAYTAIYSGNGQGSNALTVENSLLYGNNNAAIDIEPGNNGPSFNNNIIYGIPGTTTTQNQQYGIYVASNGAQITGNVVHDDPNTAIDINGGNFAVVGGNTVFNSGSGIYAYNSSNDGITANNSYNNNYGFYVYNGTSAATATDDVGQNTASNNATRGIYAQGNVLVGAATARQGNTVYGQQNTSAAGIELYNATAQYNTVFDNQIGVLTTYYTSGTILDNTVYHNGVAGIDAYNASLVQGNTVYSNAIGIVGQRYYAFTGQILNNVVYDNTNQGIFIHGANPGAEVDNNTVYQAGGDRDALAVDSNSSGLDIRNNIFWVRAASAYDIDVAPDSEVGLTSDYNDLYVSDAGNLGLWEGRAFNGPTALADWFYELGLDQHSQSVDPQIVTPIDNIAGFNATLTGPATIVDDSDPGFSLDNPANWVHVTTAGYKGDFYVNNENYPNYTMPATAQWTITGLTPGTWYQLAATWPVVGGNPYNPYDGYFSVYDGSQQTLPANTLNETTAPADFTDQGVGWRVVGLYYVASGTLTVKLTHRAYDSAVVADAVRVQAVVGNQGSGDNFHIQPGSATIDAGDPASSYFLEPGPNGGRINQGSDGNTAAATASQPQIVQVLSPNGLEKLQINHTVTINYRSEGIPAPAGYYANEVLADNPLAYYRLDDPLGSETAADDSGNHQTGAYQGGVTTGVDGALPHDSDTAALFDGSTGLVSVPDSTALRPQHVSLEAWIYPDPSASSNNYHAIAVKTTSSSWSDGYGLAIYPDGMLHFFVNNYYTNVAAPVTSGQWSQVVGSYDGTALRLYVNGILISTLPYSTAINNSTQPLLIGNAAGNYPWKGALDEVAVYGAALPAARVLDHYQHQYYGTVNIDLLQGNTVVANVASAVPDNGSYQWLIPGNTPFANNYQIRVEANDANGGNMPQGISNGPFSIANDGHLYYVNDSSLSGDVFTTAVGNNTNSGKSPDQPMATLRALLALYHPAAGDTVFVDTGSYHPLRNIAINAADSGVLIQGPSSDGAVLNRMNTAAGSYVFELDGGQSVTLDHLTMSGAVTAVYAGSGNNSSHLTLSNSILAGNSSTGVDLEQTNGFALIEGNTIYGTASQTQQYGIFLNNVNDSQLSNNTVYNNANTGIYVYNGARDQIGLAAANSGNDAYNNNYGIYVYDSSSAAADVDLVQNNIASNNYYRGIYGQSNVLIVGNTAYGQQNNSAAGIELYNVTAQKNTVYDNQIGIVTTYYTNGTILNNTVYHNSVAGIEAYNASLVQGNTVYSNGAGIVGQRYYAFTGQIVNNLVYDNTGQGIFIHGANPGAAVVNNSIYQPVGDGIDVDTASSGLNLRNNIIYTQGGSTQGYDINIAPDSEVGLSSDYNDLYFTGQGSVGLWEGRNFNGTTALADWYYELGLDQHSRSVDPQFVTPVASIQGFNSAPTGPATIVDDSDPGFSLDNPANWVHVTTAGYKGDYYVNNESYPNYTLPATAQWTITGLTPGTWYQVAATWPVVSGNPYNPYDAYFTVYEGGQQALPAPTLNETTSPSDFTDQGVGWRVVGLYYVTSGTLTVTLTHRAYDSAVVADAVRVQAVVGNQGAGDNFHIQPGSGTIDAGDPASSYFLEPSPNGGRVNQGNFGNTPGATTSASQIVQVLSPSGLEKLQVGQTVNIAWHAAGLPAPANYYSQEILNDNPLAYYRLDDAGPVANDSSPHALGGNYMGYPGVTNQVSGALPDDGDTAVALDGASGYVQLPASGFNNFAGGLTFEVWVDPTAVGSGQRFISLGNGPNSGANIELGRYSTTNNLFFSIDGGSTIYVNNAIALNQWQYFAVTVDASNHVTIYKNGQVIGSGTSNLPPVSSRADNYLGKSQYAAYGDAYFAGAMDEAAIYTSALSAARILDHYNHQYYGSVNIDLLQGGNVVANIASNVPNIQAGETYSWAIPNNGSLTPDLQYQVRVTENDGSMPVGTSPGTFLITNNGHNYYVNDNSTANDVFTSAVGNNANSGKDPAHPLASLNALVESYSLGAGDIVHIDSGTYHLYQNTFLTVQHSGATFVGPGGAGTNSDRYNANSVAVLNRMNSSTSGYYVFALNSATSVTLDHLRITGAYDGIYAASGAASTGLSVTNSSLYANSNAGVDLEASNDNASFIDDNVYGIPGPPTSQNQPYGIYVAANGLTVQGSNVNNDPNTGIYVAGGSGALIGGSLPADSNTVYNNNYGVYVNGSTAAGNADQITGNSVHDNTYRGIYAQGNTVASGNTVYNQTASNAAGIELYDATAQQNVVHDNTEGIITTYYTNGTITGNRVYHNSVAGIDAYNASTVYGNYVYTNGIGIIGDHYYTFSGQIVNNLVYANTNEGIFVHGAQPGAEVVNNTVYQLVGDALRVDSSSNDLKVRNNILWVEAGYDIDVAADSQANFNSDYNILYTGNYANARTGFWNNQNATTLANWQSLLAAAGRSPNYVVFNDQHSSAANPLFVNPAGADNVLGYTTVGGGYNGGQDDDFYLAKNSPAIDAADPWSAPPVDIVGSPRRHDPGVTQTGPDYQETNLGSSSFNASGGTAQNFHTDNTYFNLSLPFAFPFYDATYRSVSVSTEGMLVLAGSVYPGDPSDTTAKLQHNTMIAPLWEDLSTYLTSTDDIFVDTSVANQVTIRWRAQSDVDHSAFNFSVTLFSDGRIRFDYGSGNVSPAGQTPTIGISQGDGTFFVLSQYNGKTNLANVNSVQFAPTSGLTFYDIGAYEFLGDSVDTTPPTVTSTTPAVIAAQAGTPGPVTQIQVSFSKALNAVDADAPANYQLVLDANHDGIFGDSGDIAYNLTPTYTQTGTSSFVVNIDPGLGGQPLPVGHYQFTARSTIHDTSANALAGDGTNAGTDYVRTFYVTGILVTPTSGLQTAEGGGTAQFNIVLTAQPTASVTIGLQSSNTSEGTVAPSSVTFTTANWNVPQAVTVTGVDDPPAGVSPLYTIITSAAVSADPSFNGMVPADVTVTVFDSSPPVANPDAYSTPENMTLTVPAATGVLANDPDNETLTAAEVAGPSHGTLTLNADGSFSYVPATNFHGTDSFTYQAADGAVTSNIAMVTLTVVDTTVPVANPDAYSTSENATLTVPASTGVLANDTDADNDTLTAALVSGPSHGMLTLNADGSFSYVPTTNFHGNDSFTYTASDGTNTSNTATVTLTVTNIIIPVANPDAYSTPENTVLTVPAATGVLANDTGNTPLTAIQVSGPSHGNLVFNANGSFSYTPATNFHGTDSFTYKASDGANTSNTATVTLTVVDTVVPVANADSYNLLENGTLMVSAATGVLANDTDANNDTLTAILVGGPSHGTLTLNPDGSFTYVAAAKFNGKDSFSYQASDGTNVSNTATVTLTVYEYKIIERLEEIIQQRQGSSAADTSVPVANPDAYNAPQNTTSTISTSTGVLANDTDANNDTLMAQVASGPSHGTLAFNIDGSFSYTPAPNYRGIDSFTYNASDGVNTSNATDVTLAVGPATLSWEGNSDGNWTDAQWSGTASLNYPNNTVNAFVSTPYVVHVTTAQAAALALAISNGGRVNVTHGSTLAVTADTIVTGGGSLFVEPNGTFSTGGTLTVDTGGSVSGGSVAAAAFQFNSGNVSANLSGAGGLTKSGTGSVTLSGRNTYAGSTDVTSGALIVGDVTALPTGSGLTVGLGADLIFDSIASPAQASFSAAAGSAIPATATQQIAVGQGDSAVAVPAVSTISPAMAVNAGLPVKSAVVVHAGQTSSASAMTKARDTAIQAAVGWSPYKDLVGWAPPWWMSPNTQRHDGQDSLAQAADAALLQCFRS